MKTEKSQYITPYQMWLRIHGIYFGFQSFFLIRNPFFLNQLGCLCVSQDLSFSQLGYKGFGFITDINIPSINVQWQTELHYNKIIPNLLGEIKKEVDGNAFYHSPFPSNWLPHSFLTAHPDIEKRIKDTFFTFFESPKINHIDYVLFKV
mgnify:CR=1 FL=1